MQIDFNKLSKEQIDLIIDRLCNKFDSFSTENINNVSKFIETYRIKRFETGVIKTLEGDEILKGIVFGVSKKQSLPKDEENISKIIENSTEEVGIEKAENIQEEKKQGNLEDVDLMKRRFFRINKFRASSFEQQNSSDETKNNNIILDDNIKQIESKFSLSEMNSQLPSENLLDRYNFGYINLHDEDDGLEREDVLKNKTRGNILRIRDKK